MQRALISCVAYSRVLLVLGLTAGVALPGIAGAVSPYLPEMVAVLLVITAFRIGRRDALGSLADLRWSLPVVLVLQVGLPLLLAALLYISGQLQTPLGLALLLATSAPTISGGPSLALMLGQSPARLMQLLVLGTAVFPLTVLVVLHIAPVIGPSDALFSIGLRSLATIVGAAILGFVLRRLFLPHPTPDQVKAMDGAAILFFALIVVGLMAALGPSLAAAPQVVFLWMLAAFGLSFGAQILSILVLRNSRLSQMAGPVALAAGNRNIALYLVALEPAVVAPVMVFIACWQLPMYLTPILLRGLYTRARQDD